MLALFTIQVALRPHAAFADCTGEETRFIQQSASASYAYGSVNTITVKDHDIAGCSSPNFFATAQLRNTAGDKAVEVGYTDTVNGLGQEIWEIFTEGFVNYNSTVCGPTYWYLINPGRDDKFRVSNVSGTNQFNFSVDYGSGWVSVGSCTQTYSHGWAWGETGRRGGTATGASDDHKNVQFKNSSGTWNSWPNNFETSCGNPCISNWHYDWCSQTRWQIFKDGSGNTC
ncbi:MAG: hypothetical protein ACXVQ0_01850 [Actinomycetota bacterium]